MSDYSKKADPNYKTRAVVPTGKSTIETRGSRIPSTSSKSENKRNSEESSSSEEENLSDKEGKSETNSTENTNNVPTSTDQVDGQSEPDEEIPPLNEGHREERSPSPLPPPTPPPVQRQKFIALGTVESDEEEEDMMNVKMIVTLDDMNYRHWIKKMTSYLHIKDLWVDSNIDFENHSAEGKTKSIKAYHHITMFVDKANGEAIHLVSNSIDALKILKNTHESRSMSRLILSMITVMTSRIKQGETMQTHLNKLTEEFNTLSDMDSPLSAEVKIAMMLASLSGAGYDSLVTGFMAWSKDKLTVDGVKNAMLEAYVHKNMANHEFNEIGHRADINRSNENRVVNRAEGGYPRSMNRNANKFYTNTQTSSRGAPSGMGNSCFNCGKSGHQSRDCWKPRKLSNSRGGSSSGRFNRNDARSRRAEESQYDANSESDEPISYQQFSNHGTNSSYSRDSAQVAGTTSRDASFRDSDSTSQATRFSSVSHSRAAQRFNRKLATKIRRTNWYSKNFSTINNRRPLSSGHNADPHAQNDQNNRELLKIKVESNADGTRLCKFPRIMGQQEDRCTTRNIAFTDNDDPYADVSHEIDGVSPYPSSVEVFSDETSSHELLINATKSDVELEQGNKEHEIYLSRSYASNKTRNNEKDYKWIVDSGASSHMCFDENLFSTLKIINSGKIVIADGTNIPIVGIGSVELSIVDGKEKIHLKLNNVLYAPQLGVNLLSVIMLTRDSMEIIFKGTHCIMKQNLLEFELGKYKSSAYELNTHRHEVHLCVHEWHKRVAHKNIKDLKNLSLKNIKIDKCKCVDECTACIEGKLPRKSFPKASLKPKCCLDVVVSDVCGPMPVESVGRSRYFISFTDVHSDYTELRFIRKKSDAKQCVVDYVERLKTSMNKKPKIFRSDRGGEYFDFSLQQFLRNEGIEWNATVHDCPEQNGISERKNRTLCDAARTMLIESVLPQSLWAEALTNAVYTFNRIPRKGCAQSPIEIFKGNIPQVDFIEFGHPTFVCTNKQLRCKWDKRATLMRFLSVDDTSKGFRLWDGKIVRIERHVKFSKRMTSLSPICSDNDKTKNDFQSANEQIPRKSRRLQNLEPEYDTVMVATNTLEPRTYNQAISCPDKDVWKNAMKKEIEDIESKGTWTRVNLPPGKRAIGCKWVFKIKRDQNGVIHQHKARLVAQGFTQKYGDDYDEVFAPVARAATFRILLSVAGKKNLIVRHFDVKTAFLNGYLSEEIFMKIPKGELDDGRVLKLNRSLYGLKQAARVWNETLTRALLTIGFFQSKVDQCLYTYKRKDEECYLCVHVDDFLFVSTSIDLINRLAKQINTQFEIKDLGNVKHFLGIDVERDSDGNFQISQTQYITKIAESFALSDSKPQKYPLDPGYYKLTDETMMLDDNKEYRKIIGMLLYVATNSRPDISASVCILAQRIENPRLLDINEAKRVIKYLNGTKGFKLSISTSQQISNQMVLAYSDANWAEDRSSRKSNSGMIVQINGGTVAWSSRKQDVVSLSSTEAEFYALAETAKEVAWVTKILAELNVSTSDPVKIMSDNQSCIKMIENEKFSNRTKHIDTRYHYVKDMIGKKEIVLEYCPTEYNVADLFTKPLAGTKISFLRELAGLKCTPTN